MKKFWSVLTSVTLVAIVALGAVSLFSCAKKPAQITVATDATWPPMEYVDENKNIVGFDIDLVNEIAKAENFKVEIKNTAWDGISPASPRATISHRVLRHHH
jgi:polar amino acid transport system substrate-binding protein